MPDFKSLEPELRAAALVGTFLQKWSQLEFAINQTIGKVLDLNETQTAIVTANIQFRDKIHILRTACAMSLAKVPGAEEYDKELIKIATYSGHRNTLAHTRFAASQDGKAVEFFVTQARGKFRQPKTIWTIRTFQLQYGTIEKHKATIAQLQGRLTTAALATALENYWTYSQPLYPASTLGLFGLGSSHPLTHPPPGILDSFLNPPTPKKARKTPRPPKE